MEWEDIDDWTQRAAVPGGWLVKVTEPVMHINSMVHDDGWDWRIAIAFVPDVSGEWVL